jgi:hypothetical protein
LVPLPYSLLPITATPASVRWVPNSDVRPGPTRRAGSRGAITSWNATSFCARWARPPWTGPCRPKGTLAFSHACMLGCLVDWFSSKIYLHTGGCDKASRHVHSEATKPHTSTESTLNSSLHPQTAREPVVSAKRMRERESVRGSKRSVGKGVTCLRASSAKVVVEPQAHGSASSAQPRTGSGRTAPVKKSGAGAGGETHPPTERKSSPESWTKLLAPVQRKKLFFG